MYNNMRIVVDMLRARQQERRATTYVCKGLIRKILIRKTTMTIHEWFNLGTNLVGDNQKEQLREADDLLLKALSDEANGWIVKRDVLKSPMVTAMATGIGDMADAFREIAPNAESDDGKSLTYLACLV